MAQLEARQFVALEVVRSKLTCVSNIFPFGFPQLWRSSTVSYSALFAPNWGHQAVSVDPHAVTSAGQSCQNQQTTVLGTSTHVHLHMCHRLY